MELKCKDLGMKSCSFVAKGMTKAAVKKDMMKHGKDAHGVEMKKMTKTQMTAMDKKMDKLLSK